MTEPLELEFAVACSPEHAFAVWAERISLWWQRGHSLSGHPELTVVLEPSSTTGIRCSPGSRRAGWDEVYAYLVDFANHPEWRYDVLESELVQGEAGRVGARYRQRMKQGWRELTVTSELTRAEPPRAIAFRTVDSGPITASGTYDIRPAVAGTQFVVDVVIEARGFMRLFAR
jgi:Polyketide cyclase / dehydrase and lipid transport